MLGAPAKLVVLPCLYDRDAIEFASDQRLYRHFKHSAAVVGYGTVGNKQVGHDPEQKGVGAELHDAATMERLLGLVLGVASVSGNVVRIPEPVGLVVPL